MYRENIYDVIKQTGENISTIVIPKNNGLKGYAWKVLKEAGLDLEKAEVVGKNELKAGDLAILLRRGEDIPQIVVDEFEKGNLVLGLTGDDLYDEYRFRNPQSPLRIENTYDWFDEAAKFFRPTLCLINRTGSEDDIPLEARVAVSSKYEYTSRNYLQTSPLFEGKTPSVKVYTGDVESKVKENSSDCCIDTVYSSRTIKKQYKLRIVQKIRFTDLVVISSLKTEESPIGRALNKEYQQIMARKNYPTGSPTSEMLQDAEKLRRKIIEEAYEVTQALSGNGDIAREATDLLYTTMTALVQRGITLDDVAQVIRERQK